MNPLYDQLTSLNLTHFPDKSLCVKHFDDKAIKRFIRSNYSDGYCDYCNKKLKVVSYEELLPFIMEGIHYHYTDANEYMGWNGREGGFQGNIYNASELIQDLVGLNAEPFEVIEDIIESIEEIAWSNESEYDRKEDDHMRISWSNFEHSVKHRSRFMYYDEKDEFTGQHPYRILDIIGGTIDDLHLIKKIPAGIRIHRIRPHETSGEVQQLSDISSTPKSKAKYPNRFSPSGIPMLYSAFDPNTSYLETIDPSKKGFYTLGEIELKEDTYCLDLTKIPNLPSIFDERKRDIFHSISFLLSLRRSMTKSIVKDGREHIEYVPTQVFTEYIKYPFNKGRSKKIEGIIYPSSKPGGKVAMVNFWDNRECESKLNLISLLEHVVLP